MKKSLFLLIIPFMFILTSCNIIHDGKLLVTDEHYHWYKTDSGEVLDKAEHNFNVFVRVELNPTCENEGIKVYRCECGKIKKESIPALGHTFSNELSFNDENHYYECYCGGKSEISKHEFLIEGEIIAESTCTVHGSQYFSCECGYTTIKELPLIVKEEEPAENETELFTSIYKEGE